MKRIHSGFTAHTLNPHAIANNRRHRLPALAILLLSLSVMPAAGGIASAGHGQSHGHGHSGDSGTMQEMTVTANRINDYIQSYPNQVVVMDSEEISGRNLLSVTEALGAMPGVDVRQSTGLGSRISIRGSGKSGGVLVLLNGRPLNSSQYGAVDLSTLPIETIASITVFKPPVPVWLGHGTAEGAINIVTRSAADKKKKKRRSTQLRAVGGSYGTAEGSLSHRADAAFGTIMATAAAAHKDGKRTNSDRDSGNASLSWDRSLAGGKDVKVNGRYYISEHGSAGPEDNPTPDARQEYSKFSLDSRFNGLLQTTGDYGVNLYADVTDLTDDAQSGITSTLESLKWGVKGENNWYDAANVWELRLSALLEREEVDHTLSGAHHRVSAGLGAQVDRHWQSLTATVGLRGDHASDFDLNPGFSGGASYTLTGNWLVKLNSGYTVALPTFAQLYQPSHGSIDQVRGNPDLEEEKIWSFDAGIEFRPDKQRLFQLTLFRSDTTDPIVHLRGADLIYRPINGDSAFRQGIEAVFKYGFAMGLNLDLDLIVQESQLSGDGTDLPYTPCCKFSGTLQYRLAGLNTRLETTLRYTAEQYSEVENIESQKLDDYVTMDLKAAQPFKIGTTAAEWFLSVENLFDTDFAIHYGYPDDGIRFVSGLNLSF